jgi:hypothetical protein
MWTASQRIGRRIESGQEVVIFHPGDHDPSGIDMTRDIEQRIGDFLWGDGGEERFERFRIERLALNWEQIEQYGPPPNPAKITDSRSDRYIERFGHESWELDALEPSVITELVSDAVMGIRDLEAWAEIEREEERQRETLTACYDRWPEVAEFLNGGES